MLRKLLSAFGVFLITFIAGLIILRLIEPAQLRGDLLTPPKPYFSTTRTIGTVILSQKDTTVPELNRTNLLHAAVTLSTTLKKDQQYDQIIVLTDPKLPVTDPDPFQAQLAQDFPEAKYQILALGESGEADIYNKLKELTAGEQMPGHTLVIFHSYLNFSDADPDLLAYQQAHYKDVFDNISKAALGTISFTNAEALKAVYQLAKEDKSLKALPTLEDETHQYQITFLAEGGIVAPSQTATVTFFGDLMLGRYVRTLMDRSGMDYAFEEMDAGYLQMNDLLVFNLEGPLAEKAISTTKAIAFRFMPDIVPLLSKHFIDAVSQANNHTLDMGGQGLDDSYRLLAEGQIDVFGHPKSINDPHAVLLKEINGVKIALIGLNDTDFKIKQEEVIAKIVELKADGYRVMPFIHWGTEYVHRPGDAQVAMAHAFVDAGAAAVIGMHPHVVQSVEIYNNTPIFYSLGNAIFDQYFSTDTQEGLSLSARITPESTTWYLQPIKIERSQFRLMTPAEKAAFLAKLAEWWRYDQEIKDQIVKGKIVINSTKN